MADQALTIPARRVHLANTYERALGFTHRFRIDLTAPNGDYTITTSGATDTITITLLTTPADWGVVKCAMNVVTAVSGTAGGFTGQLGVDGDSVSMIAATDVKTAGPIMPTAGGAPATADASVVAAASDVIVWVGTNDTSGGPDDITAGQIDVFLGLLEFNKLMVDTSVVYS